ncbi:Cubilin [Amphibalanus amphitrite]|uniref:Cubilin n=1 Tax=Amphibalanus amphitrite TaxID=1232801 RepID=A0A6A4W2P4_AMPAM|nr:Cubilin [Amphibalanus amphitrite]
MVPGRKNAFHHHECVWLGRPRLISRDGHLEIRPALHRNVSIVTSGSGRINLNQVDLNELVDRQTYRSLQLAGGGGGGSGGWSGGSLPANLQLRLEQLEQAVQQMHGSDTAATQQPNLPGSLAARVSRLEQTVRQMEQQLQTDECASNPCQHGGTCVDRYGGYQCRCSPNWQGSNCEQDVNECTQLAGTDLGCQNGATCTNTAGGYSCQCTSGWYGTDCTERTGNCTRSNEWQLCAHGTCVNQADGHKCICQQGWKQPAGADPSSPCSEDVDECQASRPACSHDPPVPCINTPGSFRCGNCPAGYIGNGFYCTDIDECLQMNGGCSMNPMVDCINTRGNGQYCQLASGGLCSVNNGGCHPMATCYHNPAISSSHVQCTCPAGYSGSGVGPAGCYQMAGSAGITCASRPCVRGTCTDGVAGRGFTCSCPAGYTGLRCEADIDECATSPCQNGGTCTNTVGSFSCSCTGDFTGNVCQTRQQACGGVLGSPGAITFPHTGAIYTHNTDCGWLLRAPHGKVINVTFTRFHLENAPSCSFDWLQLHDGANSLAPVIGGGRFCGTRAPGGGNIVTTHNLLYMWFHSDHSEAHSGFAMHWNATDPQCGGELTDPYGSINSPGYPGQYPHSRDCVWTVEAPLGRRLQFQFAVLRLEHHENCSYDYLEVRDGYTEGAPLLQRYCSTTLPAPITTSGPYAWFRFHTDASASDQGFHITYSQIPGIPGCGGDLVGERGTLSTPTHAERYHHNMDCEWRIRVPAGERVQLVVDHFELEFSRNCIFDFVEIRDGPDPDSPLVGRYCGRESVPPPVVGTSNQLYVRFFSDISIAHGGFSATYDILCGGIYAEPTGSFHSPNYPQPYPHNKQCGYLISQPVGSIVSLQFTDFRIENHFRCAYDYVFDGKDATFPSLGKFCDEPPPNLVSTHNQMYVVFSTDASVTNYGFMANYTAIDIGCGGILEEEHGTFTSPTHPEQYPNGVECSWVIHRPPGQVIRLTWLAFSLERPTRDGHCYDTVTVYDNSSAAALSSNNVIGHRPYCGSQLPPTMTTMGNIMTIKFRADESITGEGFSASYASVNASTMCGGSYHTAYGEITSPNFPYNYPPSKDCVWTIEAPANQQIMLNFSHFHLEEHPNCRYDYLEIRNGAAESAPLVGRFCGVTVPPRITSHAHSLFLRLHTDSSMAGAGFRVTWDATATGCGGQLTGPEGSFTSPGYPQPYAHNAECTWVIAGNAGSKVRLSVLDLDLETATNCRFDFLEVYDGVGRSAVLKHRLCDTAPLDVIESTTNLMTIRMVTDISLNGRGFHARYRVDCNNVVTGHRGVIESPNFPNRYPHDRDCTWTIKAPRGNALNISFSHFDVEDPISSGCEYDFLEIKEGDDDEVPTPIGSHMCGTGYLPEPISTNKSIAYVRFKSDASVAHNGFRLEWMVNGCGGLLTEKRGFFQSPNYPGQYPSNTDCEWRIRVPPGNSIQLTIDRYDIEAIHDCIFDSLKVYGGPDVTAPLLVSLCHHQASSTVVTSQGNTMLVRFSSDSSVTGTGFHARYRRRRNGCGGRFTAMSGSIHSPNYPQVYDDHADCVWRIRVKPHHNIKLTFEDFDVEPHNNCSYDHVENVSQVRDGYSRRSPLLLQHCGNEVPQPPTIVSTSNWMYIRLKADGSRTAKGFLAKYTMGCGGIINVTSYSQVISSPHYPVELTGGLNCSWTLQTMDPGSHVWLQFTTLSMYGQLGPVNCSTDYLEVREGAGPDAPLKHRYCAGARVPPALTSRGRALQLRLQVSETVVVRFSATFNNVSTGCGGTLFSLTGMLASPGYPDSYPNEVDCWWRIGAALGNGIQLSFHAFDLEATDNCNGDYLEIREGRRTGPLLGHVCGSTAPTNISSNSTMYVRFHTNGAGTSSGFLAEFSLVCIDCEESEYESDVSEDDCLVELQVVPSETPQDGGVPNEDQSDSEPETDPPARGRVWKSLTRRLTVSEKTLAEADLQTLPEAPATHIVRRGGQVAAEWTVEPENVQRRRDRANITRETPGLKGPAAKNVKTEGEAFGLYISQDIMNIILTHTNRKLDDARQIFAEKGSSDEQRKKKYILAPLDETELRAFIGMTVLRGTFDIGVDDLFSAKHGPPLFRAAMGKQRYLALLAHISFDDAATRDDRRRADKFCIMREVFGMFDNNLRRHYTPSDDITIDESLIKYRGRCPFRVYMPQKPGRYGILHRHADVKHGGRTAFCRALAEELMLPQVQRRAKLYQEQGSLNRVTVHAIGSVLERDLMASSTSGAGPSTAGPERGRCRICMEESHAHYMELTGNAGIIRSPLYPMKYMQRDRFSWRISVDIGNFIQLNFLRQAIDFAPFGGGCRSYLKIYDGSDATAEPLTGSVCGVEAHEPVVSTTNELFVEFVSNPRYAGSLFTLFWRRLNEAPAPGQLSGIDGEDCSYSLYLEEGNRTLVTSPGFPGGYESGPTCRWTVTSDPHRRVRLTVNTMELYNYYQCSADNLTVYDGYQGLADWRPLSTLCHRSDRNTVLTSSGSQMQMAFFRERFYHRRSTAGFNVTLDTVCGGFLRAPNGVIQSPGYPARANGTLTCEWTVLVPIGNQIQVRLTQLDIPGDPSTCEHGYVVIRNGDQVDSPYLGSGRFCGTSRPSLPDTSSHRLHVKLVLTPGSDGTGGLLRLTYRSAATCGGQLVLSDQQPALTISTPNYPNIPPAFSACRWSAVAPASRAVQVDFIDSFDITTSFRCRQAYVEVRDGGTMMADRIGRRYCSDRLPPTIVTTGNAALINYYTNTSEPRGGFRARVAIATCGGTFRGRRGTLNVLNGQYETNMNCSYHILGPEGHSMRVWFPTMDMQESPNCTSDYVQVRDFNSTGEVLARYCGSRRVRAVTSSANSVFITVVTDGQRTQNRGFVLKFRASLDGCGGWLQASSGVIESPGYPHGVPRRRRCIWRIYAPAGRRIKLSTTDWQLPANARNRVGNCRTGLFAVDGFSNGSPHLNFTDTDYVYCGDSAPPTISSSGNQLALVFISRVGSGAARGFQIQYTTDEPALCGGEVTSAAGWLASPQFPRPFAGSAECRWHLTLSDAANATALVTFTAFSLNDCAASRITAEPGESRPSQTQGGYWPTHFNLTYSVKPCGGVVTGPGVQLFSPGYPDNYPNSMDCAWLVTFEDGSARVGPHSSALYYH